MASHPGDPGGGFALSEGAYRYQIKPVIDRAFSPRVFPYFPSSISVFERAFGHEEFIPDIGHQVEIGIENHTIRELAEKWLSEKRLTPKGLRTHQFKVRTWFPIPGIGEASIHSIRPHHLAELSKARAATGLSASTLNDERARLQGFFHWCVENDYLAKNPTKGWRITKGGFTRKQAELPEELEENFCNLLPEVLARWVRTIVRAPIRYSESTKIEWGWVVDHDRFSVINVPGEARKQRVPHQYVIPLAARQAMGTRGLPKTKVFEGLPENYRIRRHLFAAARELGLDPVTSPMNPTNLRRTWAARMDRAGASRLEMQRMAGWSSPDMLPDHYRPPVSYKRAVELFDRVEAEVRAQSPHSG